jgi:hypothetical protein
MARQTKYKYSIVNLPESLLSRHQKSHSKRNHISNITYKKKDKSVRNYPVVTQIVFAAIHLVPVGQAHVPALQ